MSADDDRLRELLHAAHRDDASPPFGRLWNARAKERRPLLAWAPLAALLLIALAAVVVRKQLRPDPIAADRLRIEWNDPLAFLLQPLPGGDVLTTVPKFEPRFAPHGEQR